MTKTQLQTCYRCRYSQFVLQRRAGMNFTKLKCCNGGWTQTKGKWLQDFHTCNTCALFANEDYRAAVFQEFRNDRELARIDRIKKRERLEAEGAANR